MRIMIDQAIDRGYQICFENNEAQITTYREPIYNLQDAIEYAYVLSRIIKQETGEWVEPLISKTAISHNKDYDVTARILWNNHEIATVK